MALMIKFGGWVGGFASQPASEVMRVEREREFLFLGN
jgi:hypothetical protein